MLEDTFSQGASDMVLCFQRHLFDVYYLSVIPSVCPFVRLSSRYLLLNHWEKFNQIYYMISPHGKGVQNYFSFCLSVMLSPPKTMDGMNIRLAT